MRQAQGQGTPQGQGAPRGQGEIAEALLAWYDRSARVLPWRELPGIRADPYAVWLSEIMLQQTTVKAVIPFYRKFLARWPDVTDLAAAGLDEVLAAWAGLGYYSRARNLHACARHIAERHGGRFPQNEAALLALPGIGAYTAAAISAIAFDQPATAVDGNVERVVARLFTVREPLPGAKAEIKRLAATLTPQRRPGDFAQAMMDLGATICTPRSPACAICPLLGACLAARQGIAASLPLKAPKKDRPVRRGTAFVAMRADGAVLLRRRAPKGLLGGMLEVPSTEWFSDGPDRIAKACDAPFPADWRPIAGTVSHTFTHFQLELAVFLALDVRSDIPSGCVWYPRASWRDEALPSVMRKVLAHALPDERQIPRDDGETPGFV